MFLGRVRGRVVATRKEEGLRGAHLRIVQPLRHDGAAQGGLLVAVDMVSAREGDLVYLVKGREATIPWPVPLTPIDAMIVGIVEGMDVA